MKGRNAALVTTCITVLAFVFIAIVLFRWSKVKLEFQASIGYTGDTDVPAETKIWWTQIRESGQADYLGQQLIDYIECFDFSDSYLVVSWGLPIASLSYRKIDSLNLSCSSNGIVAKPIFQNVEYTAEIYVYKMKHIELIDEYLARIERIPTLTIEG